MNTQHFSRIRNPQPAANNEQQPAREARYRFTGDFHYYGKTRHKAFECRTRNREEQQRKDNDQQQEQQEGRPKYNPKLPDMQLHGTLSQDVSPKEPACFRIPSSPIREADAK